jgi:hypothetical protein
MAKDQTKRIRPEVLATDRESLDAIKSITDYAPANPAYSTAALNAARTAMDSAQAAETQAAAALAAARDAAAAAEWELHNKILSMKDQVTAQYGRDSTQVQAIGLKRVSERKTPGRSSKKSSTH